MWSTATIEIHPYKDPCHCTCKSCMFGHFVSETVCIRHLPGSLPRLPAWEHPQGHYNYVVMEIFMPLIATGDSLTDVTRGLLWYIED